MKKFLRNIACFIPFFLVLYVIGVCIVGTYMPQYFKFGMRYKRSGGGHLFSRIEEVKKTKDVDILFVGTSHCYRGFDTRIFTKAGYKSFNLGSSIQTALQTEVLMKKYLDRLNPKLVVFEVNPVIFGSDGVESSLDLISNDRIDLLTVKMAFNVNRPKSYNTLIYGLYRQIFNLGNEDKELQKYFHDTYIPGGYVETKRSRCADAMYKYKPTAYEFCDKQLEAFYNVLAMLRAKKIPYVLLQAPISKPLYRSKTNNRYVDSLLASKGRYYNFNRLLRMDDRADFFDDNHLNKQGVNKFDGAVITLFERNGIMP
jgi:hypothetical protein